MKQLTIFTPTYNRAHTLPRTYDSLRNQNCKEFIWLIVDDGSTDQTAELVRKWQAENTAFEIRYIYKPNGGMHTAHNTAYENIDTELNVCIDSDDCVAENAVSAILEKWNKVKNTLFHFYTFGVCRYVFLLKWKTFLLLEEMQTPHNNFRKM